ncbi:MAG: pyruvate, phosphate dikinase [Planctomycetota bacterium]|nr:pyruvate, phosphate dikinase [Planctomycetota bacterium]
MPRAKAIKRKSGGQKAPRTIWHFGPGKADGQATDRDLLGGKGANLAEMCRIGLPVPPGFTIATTVCDRYYQADRRLPADVVGEVRQAIRKLEQATGKGFGNPDRPLLVSVRSGARLSMPGMMDTVLNLGLNAAAMEGLARQTGNRRFALDARRRFIQMFANVVEGLGLARFEHLLELAQETAGVESDSQLDEAALERVVADYLKLFAKLAGRPFPDDPEEQLLRSIAAVFGSWMGGRAVEYRRIHKIDGLLGTAVNVQSMVFGNLGPTSGTGVCFTRDPSTGEDVFYGEYLMNAQGEDVVAGIRTPQVLAGLAKESPKAFKQLEGVRRVLEKHYRDMQDIEFTIEQGTLYILQTRTGKRTARAAVRIAVEMANKRLITRPEAVARIAPEELDRLLHPQFDPKAERQVIATGLPASPGAVCGQVVFTADDAKDHAARGVPVILVRNETSPEDVGGMHAAEGILTATGGMTSHAAVVARGMGKCCVSGAGAVRIDDVARTFRVGETVVAHGDILSLDGSSGQVMLGTVRTMPADPGSEFETLLGWADKLRTMRVRANADTPADAKAARAFGAEGIGLCRTEHMFFGDDRITPMREMILAEDERARRKALRKLLPYQRRDFAGILKAMDGLPVTIRLLDPPLHEFLPHDDAGVTAVAKSLGVPAEEVRERARRLHEMNPMLGHRGCRLGITYPEIYEMQVLAIFEAACANKKKGQNPQPEVMIPLIGSVTEYTTLRDRLEAIAKDVIAKKGIKVPVIFGTMIEIPRAALRAEEIGAEASFFSFGTNDLTQLTFGFSRDDVGSFLPGYVEQRILPADPFQTLDQTGVGELVRLATERGRASKPGLKVGICGEHGGDPASIAFCQSVGLDYVSCSPFRVPIARLAAAHAAAGAAEADV